MFFFVRTKNLNWEILTNDLVTFKKWDEIKDENFQYYGGSLKKLIFSGDGGRGWAQKTNMQGVIAAVTLQSF